MARHLETKLGLHWHSKDEYAATVTTVVTDACYKAKDIRCGLPPGLEGIPEFSYIIAELSHDGQLCGESLGEIKQEIGGVHSSGKRAVCVFVLVNGEIVGTDIRGFPRVESAMDLLPLELDWSSLQVSSEPNLAQNAACRDFPIVKVKSWPEFKPVTKRVCKVVLGHKVCVDVPDGTKRRECTLEITANICHPNLNDIANDVEDCLKQAAIAGVTAAIIGETPAAGAAALTSYLKVCLAAKGVKRASEITVNLRAASTTCGDWH